MNPRSFGAALAAAVVLFIWQSVSHIFIPWFHNSLNSFEDEQAIEAAILANAKVDGELTDGIYTLPNVNPHGDFQSKEELQSATKVAQQQMAEGVSIFAAVVTQGRGGMREGLAKQFVFNLLGALLVTFLLTKLSHDGMGCRMGVTVFFSLFAIVTAVLPNWAWWAFSVSHTGFLIFDHLIGWILAGYVLAKMVPKNESPEEEATTAKTA